jgi:hypothetical protein
MKSIKKIIKQSPVFLHNWENRFSVIADFFDVYMTEKEFLDETKDNEYYREKRKRMESALTETRNVNILFASYGTDNYCGGAFVLFESNGVLYEVNGSHCSCFGLEGQWEPEVVSLEELKHRLEKGTFGSDDYCDNVFKDELKSFLGI